MKLARLHSALLATLLGAVIGCQNSAELRHPLEVVAADGKAIVEVIDEVCTTPPEKINSLRERMLYYLEYNDHTNVNDPVVTPCSGCLDTTQRVELVNKVTVKLAGQNIDRQSLLQTFNDNVTDRSGGFIDDPSNIAQGLVGSSGGTLSDVLNTIVNMENAITTDVLQNHEESVTRYNIFLVVSGEPNVDDDFLTLADPEKPVNILAAVDDLVLLKSTFGIFDISLNIILLASLTDNIANSVTLYNQMVSKTGGKFMVVYPTSGGPDATIDINDYDYFNTKIATMNFDQIMVVNRNVRLNTEGGAAVYEVDSDTDGLSDDDEEVRGTDPMDTDSDDDFFSDAIEVSIGTNPNNANDHICLTSDQGDTDKDSLPDCVELTLGLDPLLWDTDGDRIPDYLELIYHTNPLLKDANDDMDEDGISNIDEIVNGLDPQHPTSDDDVTTFSQVYESTIISKPVEKVECLQLTVKNVPLMPNQDDNRNKIEVQLQEAPQSPVPFGILRRVFYKTVGEMEDGQPVKIKVFIDPLDFEAVEQKG